MYKNLKEEIIEKSFELFKENGYDNITINDICKACSITKPTFYRYLSSKEAILTFFFYNVGDELSSLMLKLTNADSCYQQILVVFDMIFNKMHIFGKELYSQVYIANLKSDAGSFKEIPVVKETVISLLNKGKQNGEILIDADAATLYDLCSDLCFGCGIKWCMGLVDDPRKEFVGLLPVALNINL